MPTSPSVLCAEDSLDVWLRDIESRNPTMIHLGLDRIRHVAERLSLLRFDATVILVAGTNGKGSTVHLLEQVYHRAGYCVGTYTSPHLQRFNERIRIAGQMVSDAQIINAFLAIEKARGQTFLSYFEMATLAALYCFQSASLDIMLIEVGLGGRLDATNILDPDLCVITSIGYDHQEWLGDTLDSIAAEKAGILRPGVPLVYGDSRMYDSVKEKIRTCVSPCYQNSVDFGVHSSGFEYYILDSKIKLGTKPYLHPNAIATAAMVLSVLQDKYSVDWHLFQEVAQETRLLGRQQVIKRDAWLCLDVAHNAQSVTDLAERLKGGVVEKPNVQVVFSALSDKPLSDLVIPILPFACAWHVSALPNPRTHEGSAIRAVISDLGGHNIELYDTIDDAFAKVWHNRKNTDLVLVYGSFYTVSAVLNHPLYLNILGDKHEVYNGRNNETPLDRGDRHHINCSRLRSSLIEKE